MTRVGELAGGRGPNAQLYAVVAEQRVRRRASTSARPAWSPRRPTSPGRLTARVEVSTDDADDPVGRVHAAVVEAAKQAGASWDRVRRVVLGTPGVVDPASGDISFAFDLPRWHRGLRDALSADLDRPVVVRERREPGRGRRGPARARPRAYDDFALVWISRGVGLAVVLGGRLHRGSAGAAGEIGYLYVPGGPLPDYDPRRQPARRHPARSSRRSARRPSGPSPATHGFRADRRRPARSPPRSPAGTRRGAGPRRAGPPGRAGCAGGLRGARPVAGGAGRRRRQRRRVGPGRPGAGPRGAAGAGVAAGGGDRGDAATRCCRARCSTALDATREEVFATPMPGARTA